MVLYIANKAHVNNFWDMKEVPQILYSWASRAGNWIYMMRYIDENDCEMAKFDHDMPLVLTSTKCDVIANMNKLVNSTQHN